MKIIKLTKCEIDGGNQNNVLFNLANIESIVVAENMSRKFIGSRITCVSGKEYIIFQSVDEITSMIEELVCLDKEDNS